MTDEQTTGTQSQDGGDAAVTQTTGTPGDEGRDAGSQEPDYKQMYLAAKEKVEDANRLREQRASEEAQAQSPAAQEPAEDESYLENLRYAAQKGDPAAIASLKIMEREQQRERDLVDYIQLQALPAEERDGVTKHYLRNRGRLGDVKAARAEVREGSLAKRVEELERRNALLSKTPPDPTVAQAPPTSGREYSAPNRGIDMNADDYDTEAQTLSPLEALKRSVEVAEGRIRIKK